MNRARRRKEGLIRARPAAEHPAQAVPGPGTETRQRAAIAMDDKTQPEALVIPWGQNAGARGHRRIPGAQTPARLEPVEEILHRTDALEPAEFDPPAKQLANRQAHLLDKRRVHGIDRILERQAMIAQRTGPRDQQV